MNESRFNNETGLDLSSSESGGYSSSRDVAFLFAYVLRNHPEILEATRHEIFNVKSENNIKHSATNTNIGIQNIPGLIASKTGYTDMAGGNLAIVFDPGVGRPIVVVALGSSEVGRFSDISLLTKTTFEYLSQGH
jgi:D-alanyl-D-alanine carboxypeptidase